MSKAFRHISHGSRRLAGYSMTARTQKAGKRTVLRAWGGTLLVCALNPEAVYMAADSRYVGLGPPLADRAHKVVGIGPSALCGFSGLLRFTRTVFNDQERTAIDEATFELPAIVSQLAPLQAQPKPENIASSFAEAVECAVAPIWKRFGGELDEPFRHPQSRSNRLAELVYLDRSPDGYVSFVALELRYSSHRTGTHTYEILLEKPVVKSRLFGRVPTPVVHWRGMTSCVADKGTLNMAEFQKGPAAAILKAFASAQMTRRCKSAIGGPIDIGSIGASGRRWIQSKREPTVSDRAPERP
jgi:hypothetical protein